MAKIYLQRLSAFIERATLPERDQVTLECKHFFSGAALYVNSRICLSLTPLGFALKLPKKTRECLFEHKKAIPLRYFDQGSIKNEYVLFPENVERAEDTLYPYVAESIRFVRTLPKPRKSA